MIELYNSTLNISYLKKAEQFCNEAIRLFSDKKDSGFYLSESDHTELFMNPKEVYDGAIPSGNSVIAYNFVRLYRLTENEKYHELAEKQLAFLSSQAIDYPAGHCKFTIPFLSNILVTKENEKYPLLNDKTTYYVCRNHACLPPVNGQ